MESHDRKRVVWCGSNPSKKLHVELKNRGSVRLSSRAKGTSLRDLRATRGIVVEFEGEDEQTYIQWVRKYASQVLDHGIRIALVISKASLNREPFGRAADHFRRDFYWDDLIRIFQYRELKNIRRIKEPWIDMAEWLTRGYDPGPGYNSKLNIVPDLKSEDATADRILFKRAFHDYGEIEIQEYKGGKSGASVYCVTPKRPTNGKRSLPFLAKVGPKEKIRGELINYKEYVSAHVPFNHRPNCDGARTAIGRERGILVQDFVEDSVQLSKIIGNGDTARLVSSIFDGPLRGWRNTATLRTKALINSFPNLQSLEKKAVLIASSKFAQTNYKCQIDVPELFASLRDLKEIEHLDSYAHFDLHAENIFLTSQSPTLVLIDFGVTGGGPLVADPACLEVDLAFKVAVDCPYALRNELYAFPLQSPRRLSFRIRYRWLRKAVRIIRERGCNAEPSRNAYVFAVIRYLLRFAAYDDQGTSDSRGQAYSFAASLAEALKAALDVGHV